MSNATPAHRRRRPSITDFCARGPGRRGVLLLVVLSMLTLFMLLGVTYLVLASRVRATSRAFLGLADDQARDSIAAFPLLRRAALQVFRGATPNSTSVLKGHDLLADKYGDSVQCQLQRSAALVADGQLLTVVINTLSPNDAMGRVLTFLDGPPSIANTSARIAHATRNGDETTLYIPRPASLAPGDNLSQLSWVLINGRDFAGKGFTASSGAGTGVASLDLTAFLPNPRFEAVKGKANEDYDAVDEQNWALASFDGQADKSFVRTAVLKYWADLLDQSALGTAVAESRNPSVSLDPALLNLRRATLRPFAFDHWQDAPGSTDFTGKSLTQLDVVTKAIADVDNDGDGLLDSVWLDLGESVVKLRDGTNVKPLFAIHCVDLGGRLNLNAHGSPTQLAETNIVNDQRLAVGRGDWGVGSTRPSRLRSGLGFGPADIRVDSVLNATTTNAAFLGTNSAGGMDDGIRRDLPPVVGRYGDGIAAATAPALPGQPGVNDRRATNPAALWTDRGVPEQYSTPNGPPSLFGGSPPDFWGRLSVGIDHRGQPLYLPRNTSASVNDATDNPYELDLFRSKPSNAYAGTTPAWVDQPFTAAELECILRPFDIDNASALPPRALAMVLAGGPQSLDLHRAAITTESWDTPAIISTDLVSEISQAAADHDPDIAAGLKMDINRPFGDALDNNSNGVVDEPGEIGDTYAANYGGGWLLTRGIRTPAVAQPGPDEPLLRARQIFAWNLFSLLKTIKSKFAAPTENSLRLFAVASDTDTSTPPLPPLAVDSALNDGNGGDPSKQESYNDKVLAQWAVNVVDFVDPDAIMTPFRYQSGGSTTTYVVWGCEFPDVMISETLAFHDRRTADTKCDPTKESTTDFRTQYQTRYNAWMAWKNAGRIGPEPPYPQPTNADATATPDDPDFDQIRIPEGSLFIELYGTRSPTVPNLPRELYSYTNGTWQLDLGRTPRPDSPPVWRLSLATSRTQKPANDVFQKIKDNPDTTWLSPGTNRNQVADLIDVDRYVWLSTAGSSTSALPATPGAGVSAGPTRDNTFYVQQASGLGNPTLRPGGYLVVGPRAATAVGSIQGGAAGQKWGVPSNQKIVLQASGNVNAPAVGVYDLEGQPNPVASPPTGHIGNALPPPSARAETSATIVAMDAPAGGGWTSWNQQTMEGVGTSGIGLNISEPLRNAYYPCPTVKNARNNLYDAYGPLDDDTHTSFLPTPLDQSGPLAAKMLSGGTYANFSTVFVERLADPTKPHDPDPASGNWNPYIVVDFMPVDLTVFNGEAAAPDPSETQGPDRGLAAPIPHVAPFPASPADPLPPTHVPLPIGDVTQLATRQTYFHTRQRGFGKDLPNYDNEQTLFCAANSPVYRNLHPFKPIGAIDDVQDTPLATGAVGGELLPGGKPTQPRTDLAAANNSYFLHELGQSAANRQIPADWKSVPYHSLGWVNSSFGRRLDVADGVPDAYAGAPDRPFPWIVWLDRPFANPFELIYVPRTPPGRLFTNYRNLDYPEEKNPDKQYPNTTSKTYNIGDFFAACGPGAHLLPITSITDVPGPGASRTRNADVFVMLFEYVRVRSPFVGTETVLTGLGQDASGNTDGRPSRFVGPFNRVSRYREPARINLNTIDQRTDGTGKNLWNALCGLERDATATPSFDRAIAQTSTFRTVDTASSDKYARPFRIARADRSDYFSPSKRYVNALFASPWAPATASSPAQLSPRSFTLFGDLPATPPVPLFEPPAYESAANDGTKNAWFRFDALVRANANATVRSETYAVWVTMGLFEVEAIGTTNERYRDGYRLVREYGSATGDFTRHRAFYIFDRSIPVGYEAGNDLNVQDAILVERFIE